VTDLTGETLETTGKVIEKSTDGLKKLIPFGQGK